VLKRIYAEAGRDLEKYLDLVPLDPQWRSFFEDGTTLDLVADVPSMRATLDEFAPGSGSGDGYGRFMALSQRLHRLSDEFFFWRSVGGMRDMVNVRKSFSVGFLKELMGMRPGHSVAGTVRSYVPDARAAQMLDHYTQYVGSCPEQSPAVLCGIAHLQSNDGVWYPRGGTGAVTGPPAPASPSAFFGATSPGAYGASPYAGQPGVPPGFAPAGVASPSLLPNGVASTLPSFPAQGAEAALRETSVLLRAVVEACIQRGIFTREEFHARVRALQ
jgi:hypothetical protein